MLIPLHRSFFSPRCFGVAPPPRRPPPSPQQQNCTPPLISRRAASSAQGAAAVTGGGGMFVYFIISCFTKGRPAAAMVNGLWFRSVCAALSYLIKYLRRLIGPGRSGPGGGGGGGAPRRSARVANGRRREGARARGRQKLGVDAGARPLWFSRGGYLGGGGVNRVPLPPVHQLLTLARGHAPSRSAGARWRSQKFVHEPLRAEVAPLDHAATKPGETSVQQEVMSGAARRRRRRQRSGARLFYPPHRSPAGRQGEIN